MEYLILLIYKLIMNVLSCVLLPVFCLLLPPLASTAPEASFFSSAAPHMQNQRKSSCWWVVSLLLTSRGKYIYQRSGASYAGKYAFAILWTGCLERDQDDFILYHECSELLEWKALEKKRSPGGIETLVSSKHFGKPRFKLNYILTKGDYVHFDFQVNGIEVPRHRSKEKAVVHFPASNKDAVSSGDIDYDLHVYKGSNRVAVRKHVLQKDSATKKFHWAWQHRKRPGNGKKGAYLFQAHDVEAEITVVKHWEKKGK